MLTYVKTKESRDKRKTQEFEFAEFNLLSEAVKTLGKEEVINLFTYGFVIKQSKEALDLLNSEGFIQQSEPIAVLPRILAKLKQPVTS